MYSEICLQKICRHKSLRELGIIALIIIGLVINHIDKTGNSGYQGGIALLIIALFVIRGVSKYL